MNIEDFLIDFAKFLKKSKFGQYLISVIWINDDINQNDSVDLENETAEEVTKQVKGSKKGYTYKFKK